MSSSDSADNISLGQQSLLMKGFILVSFAAENMRNGFCRDSRLLGDAFSGMTRG